jgi:ABC-type uncharacterized transport system permease subunit
VSRILLGLLIAAHVFLLIGVGAAYHELPLVNKESVFSFLALAILVVYSILELRLKVKTTGVFLLAVAGLLHFLSLPMVTARPEIRPLLQNPFFGVHVVLAILGYTSFLISVCYGGLYLALYRQIKDRKFGLAFQRIPPLDLLSRMNAHAAVLGFGCLTVSIVLGVLLSRHLEKHFLTDPTFLQSMATWVGYALFALAYYTLRWRGLRQVYCSMGSFAIGLLSISVVLMSYRSFHTFG